MIKTIIISPGERERVEFSGAVMDDRTIQTDAPDIEFNGVRGVDTISISVIVSICGGSIFLISLGLFLLKLLSPPAGIGG